MKMTRIVVKSKVGSDGVLRLDLPVGQTEADKEVQVTIEPVPRPKSAGVVLPPGYFNLIGSIDDETFVRPPQGELPPPVEME
jgi:hypothetical protein